MDVLEEYKKFYTFEPIDSLIERLDQNFWDNIKPLLTQTQTILLGTYTDYYYQEINEFLLNSCPHNSYLERSIKLIDEAINVSKINEPLILYRGTKEKDFNKNIKKIGTSEIIIPTFISTSIDYRIADKFKTDLILKISIPSNYPAIWLNNLSLNNREREILLGKDINFDVISKQKQKDKENNEFTFMELKPKTLVKTSN